MHLFLVGAGHVGLVTAVGFAKLGHRVTVADIDAARIEGLRGGSPPVFEPGLEAAIRAYAGQRRLDFTTDLHPPPDASVSIVAVSTPTGRDGPLSTANVEAAVRALLDAVGPEHTIVVRSTLPVDGPARLLALAAGWAATGERPAIVTNPEFMREGSAIADFETPNRIVAGWLEPRDHAAAEAVLALYEGLHAPTMIADARSVALIKLASNVFLAAKVAYANELARICDVVGADVDTVAAGIGMDTRIGGAVPKPRPGAGGGGAAPRGPGAHPGGGRGGPAGASAAPQRREAQSRLAHLLGHHDVARVVNEVAGHAPGQCSPVELGVVAPLGGHEHRVGARDGLGDGGGRLQLGVGTKGLLDRARVGAHDACPGLAQVARQREGGRLADIVRVRLEGEAEQRDTPARQRCQAALAVEQLPEPPHDRALVDLVGVAHRVDEWRRHAARGGGQR